MTKEQEREAIFETYKLELAEAANDEDAQRVYMLTKDALERDYITADQAREIFTMRPELPPASDLEINLDAEPKKPSVGKRDAKRVVEEDRAAWEEEQKILSERLKDAEGEVARLSDELKEARKLAKQIEEAILGMAGKGSKGFKSGRLF